MPILFGKQFRLDSTSVASLLIYLTGRFYLKPHHIGGSFVHDYLNDLLCLPLFLPPTLGLQRIVGLRRDNLPPRIWEIIQHAIVFSLIFEVILPKYPQYFRTTADPWDAFCYLVGGLAAAALTWRRAEFFAAICRTGRPRAKVATPLAPEVAS